MNLLSLSLKEWIEEINRYDAVRDEFKRELVEKLTLESDKVNLNEVKEYYEELKKGIKANYPFCRVFKIKSVYRATFGRNEIFGTIPFEVGLSFNWIFNVPVIYGSEIKGAVRYVYRSNKKEDSIFDTDRVGFTDAMPIAYTNHLLYPDVMTPHYTKVKNEADVVPTPIVHLVVSSGVTFEFIFYTNAKNTDDLVSAIKDAINLGIGAKTSVGYSTFELSGKEEEC
ncbi:type III-B CRISPR module RAMP protein Cmr6 [Sulfolobus tengchongensis]|uniref:Type III-B CRISPR module RAMP protein Cmr6 n=1 Tax=Sulfolobus tengchongensis TaxID=207809 RepID=A0AAX4L1R5_9CREN